MKIEDNIKIIKLIDTYGELLTKRQFDVVSSYYFDNLTLSEIGDNFNISRQAVSDSIGQSIKTLQSYEDKLKIITTQTDIIEQLTEICQNCKDSSLQQRLIKIIEELRG